MRKKYKIVMAFGSFDLLHPGHTFFLKKAKEFGQKLIVVLARDKTIVKIKGQSPKNTEIKRKHELEKVISVDTVVLGNFGDKYKVIRENMPDCICLGYDQKYFVEGLKKFFSDIPVFRMKAYKPKIYKSSLYRNKEKV